MYLNRILFTECNFRRLYVRQIVEAGYTTYLKRTFQKSNKTKTGTLLYLPNNPQQDLWRCRSFDISFWLYWPKSQRKSWIAYRVSLSCVDLPPMHTSYHRSLIFYTFMHLCLEYWLPKTIGQSDLYLSNGSHFGYFLYVPLRPTWVSLEPSYLTQLWIYTGGTHKEK